MYRLGDDGRYPALVGGHGGAHRLDVVAGHLCEVGRQITPPLPVAGDALGGSAPEVRAMVGVGAPDDDLPVGLAPELMYRPGDLERRVNRF